MLAPKSENTLSSNYNSFLLLQLWATCFRPELVRPTLERQLKQLQMDYVDLFLVHLPTPMKVSI